MLFLLWVLEKAAREGALGVTTHSDWYGLRGSARPRAGGHLGKKWMTRELGKDAV